MTHWIEILRWPVVVLVVQGTARRCWALWLLTKIDRENAYTVIREEGL